MRRHEIANNKSGNNTHQFKMLKPIAARGSVARHSQERQYPSVPAAEQPRTDVYSTNRCNSGMKCKRAYCSSSGPHQTTALSYIFRLVNLKAVFLLAGLSIGAVPSNTTARRGLFRLLRNTATAMGRTDISPNGPLSK